MDKSITHIKTKAFAVRIIRFYKYLSEEKHEYVLAKQILRAGTSIGANVRESYSAQSRADFYKQTKHCIKRSRRNTILVRNIFRKRDNNAI